MAPRAGARPRGPQGVQLGPLAGKCPGHTWDFRWAEGPLREGLRARAAPLFTRGRDVGSAGGRHAAGGNDREAIGARTLSSAQGSCAGATPWGLLGLDFPHGLGTGVEAAQADSRRAFPDRRVQTLSRWLRGGGCSLRASLASPRSKDAHGPSWAPPGTDMPTPPASRAPRPGSA